jgi:hypothetical protein
MDRDWGSKTGGGGMASSSYSNVDRRERLRQLALETIDLAKARRRRLAFARRCVFECAGGAGAAPFRACGNLGALSFRIISGGVGGLRARRGNPAQDPYFMKNHLGSYECKLCLTLHNNEGSYLAHTQGKRHQLNLARRGAHTRAPAFLSVPSFLPARVSVG